VPDLHVVLPESTLEGLQLYVHYPSRRHMPSRVRAFVEFVVEKMENHPDLLVEPEVFAARAPRPRRNGRDRGG
jgi:hypothetical protein